MDRPSEYQPVTVSGQASTTQGGTVLARWAWTEPTVWTVRMLTALQRRVKEGVGWPDPFSAEYGLWSLQATHGFVCQPSGR